MNVKNKLVIFDFDGVLVNTLDICFNINKEINEDLTWKKFQDFSNGNFIETITKAENSKAHKIPTNFYEKYQENLQYIKVIDILSHAIKKLSEKYILAIVSASFSYIILDFLKKEKLDKYFTTVLGSNIHKSKVVKINMLLDDFKIKSNETVFVTDTLGDVLQGNECSISSIGVTWGLHSKETLEEGNPAAIIDNPEELLGTIENMLK